MLSAQTIESVLRAVQERHWMLLIRKRIEEDSLHKAWEWRRDTFVAPDEYPEATFNEPEPTLTPITESQLIDWPEDLDPFPEDGAIDSIKLGVRALEQARSELDWLTRTGYIAAKASVSTVETESTGIPRQVQWTPLGRTTAENLHDQLPRFASAVDQLRAIENWPVIQKRGFVGSRWENARWVTVVHPDNTGSSYFEYDAITGGSLSTPFSIQSNAGTKRDHRGYAVSCDPNIEFSRDPEGFSWIVESGAFQVTAPDDSVTKIGHLQTSATIQEGMETLVEPSVWPEVEAPHLEVQTELYKRRYEVPYYSRGKFGDIGEKLRRLYPTKLPGSHWIKVNGGSVVENKSRRWGAENGGTGTGPVAYQAAMTWMDLPEINVGNSGWTSYIDDADLVGRLEMAMSFYWEEGLTIDEVFGYEMPLLPKVNYYRSSTGSSDADGARHQHYPIQGAGFQLMTETVGFPNFTDHYPNSSANDGVVPYAIGTVEPVFSEEFPVRVHVGRGVSDRNQTAWLECDWSGFGSLKLRGSNEAFEVIYETDPNVVIVDHDKPLSVANVEPGSFDFPPSEEFTEQQKNQSGFESRAAYLAAWHQPRLCQVKGGDLLVEIVYKTSYRKELKFYWAKDAGEKDARGFYNPTESLSFKTVTLCNPSGPDPEETPRLATDINHLVVLDNGISHWLERVKDDPEETEDPKLTWKVRAYDHEVPVTSIEEPSDCRSKNDVERPLYFEYEGDNQWLMTSLYDGVASQTAITCFSGINPFTSTDPIIKKVVVTAGGKTRTMEAEWTVNGWNSTGWTPSEIKYSGSNWERDGTVLTYDADGFPAFEVSQVDGKQHMLAHTWTGLSHTTVSSLGGIPYRVEVGTYEPGLQKYSVSVDDHPSHVVEFDPASSSRVARIVYSNGYQEKTVRTLLQDESTFEQLTGWGEFYQGGVKSKAVLNRFGGMVSKRISAAGDLELSNAEATEFTAWGAPKGYTLKRGEKTSLYYNEGVSSSGERRIYGSPRGGTDASGNTFVLESPDWLLRPEKVINWSGTYHFDYSSPLQPSMTAPGNKQVSSTLSAFGDLTEHSDTRGSGLSMSLNANGGSVTVGGRTVDLDGDGRWGITGSKGGLGRRGSATSWSVEIMENGGGLGRLCATTVSRDGNDGSHFETKTWFDGHGRPLLRQIPAPSGGDDVLAETWTYNDAANTVTYLGGSGPSFKPISRRLSHEPNGTTVTVSEGGVDRSRTVNQVDDNKVITIQEIFDNSALRFDAANPHAGKDWIEVSRTVYDPTTGESTFTPWGLAAAQTKMKADAPGASTFVTQTLGPTDDKPQVELENGRIKRISGSSGGVAFDLNQWAYPNGELRSVRGSIGGVAHGMEWDGSGRMVRSFGLGYDRSFQYGGAPGYQVTTSDSVTGTTQVVKRNSVGDFTELSGDVAEPILASTVDLAGGTTRTSVNGSLVVDHAANGAVLKKNYASGSLVENFDYRPDGTLASSGVGLDIATSIHSDNYQIAETFPGVGTVTQTFSSLGARRQVQSLTDGRQFSYLHGQLSEEHHTGGVWSGWDVKRGADNKGRINGASVSQGDAIVSSCTYGYDNFGRISSAGSSTLSATYTYDAFGRVQTCTRGNLTTTWGYNNRGWLTSVGTRTSGGLLVVSSSHGYNPRGLRVSRTSNSGVSWSGMTYDGNGCLRGANLGNGTSLNYNYDARGNRLSGGGPVTFFVNGLDQVTGRELGQRGYGVSGSVAAGAKVRVFHPLGPVEGEEITVNQNTGAYSAFWPVAPEWNGGGVTRVEMLVRGTLAGAGTGGTNAVADKQVWVVVPGLVESFVYDGSGRLVQDSEWVYSWNGMGHLTSMARKPGTSKEADLISEALIFQYDGDGRRVQRIRTRTYVNLPAKVEASAMLWDGWLPMLEDRVVDGVVLPRRRFVWGLDITGTLDGAGGIGGLIAIEEQGGRILLPIHDGLGNITKVVDKASGSTVAEYSYGPYGEMVGQSGDVNACPFRYQSKYHDAETGLSYFGFRYYSAKLGRWISRDPLGESGGFNLYGYCGNDPVNRWDYLGMAWPWIGAEKLFEKFDLPLAEDSPMDYGHDITQFEFAGKHLRSSIEEQRAPTSYEIAMRLSPKVPTGGGMLHQSRGIGAHLLVSTAEIFQLFGSAGSLSEDYWNNYLYLNYTKDEREDAAFASNAIQIVGPAAAEKGIAVASRMLRFGARKAAPYVLSVSMETAPLLPARNALWPSWGLEAEVIVAKDGGAWWLSTKWTPKAINGHRVYQRNDLFNPSQLTTWKERGKFVQGTNLERMRTGRAPVGYDGKAVNLHHTIQTADGPLAEVAGGFHQMHYNTLHINTGQLPSGIDRAVFDTWRSEYWIQRAADF
ncbi:RHS repeat-associated core domain-containing protein [Verrucomicrobium sp. BvORR034]|uniref:RHS repeat-associated core domain-containing protein n=1 Tax=Verrucomicrobium sp. BvORR034 TaxID=1396418 RepID=UPI002240EC61|nr:RHS repeat-associated core domain-containing protein [Verrucomicrobium sp. BvORR034]